MKKEFNLLISMLLISIMITSCSEESSSGSAIASNKVTLSATIVDPYISGAQFCIDSNFSKTCDSGEVMSTVSNANGAVSFSLDTAISERTLIIADPTKLGLHNGVNYTLEMAALIEAGTTSTIISPLTTLQGSTADTTGGVLNTALTDANIVTLLKTAGLTDITEADINADPMSNVSTLSGTVTEAQLARIRAALIVYGFTRVFEVSNTLKSLTPAQIMSSGTDTTNITGLNGVYQILSTMVTAVKSAVSPAVISSAQIPIDTANATIAASPASAYQLPAVTAEVIVKTGVAIIDRIAGDAAQACNDNNGDYNAGLTKANSYLNNPSLATAIGDLGVTYYGAHNKSSLEALLNVTSLVGSTTMASLGAPVELDIGRTCTSGHFTVDASLNSSCVQ